MAGFRGSVSAGTGQRAYAGVAGADLENSPTGTVPFTSQFGLPVTRMVMWHAGGNEPGASTHGVPGRVIQPASGNPDVATVPAQVFRSPYGGMQQGLTEYVPGNPNAPKIGGIPQFGTPRPLNPEQEAATPRQPVIGSENDKLITYDRHAIMKVGYENSGRNSGQTDPPSDGPARPSLWLVQRTINYQQGTDNDSNQDDLSRDYTRTTTAPTADPSTISPRFRTYQGREGAQYVGEQGTGWSRIYGGVPGLWQPYGSYAGVTNGIVQGIQAPVPEGAQGDGPRTVWSGPPHGLHSPTLPSYDQTLGRYMAVPQMNLPRQDRPSNSPIAGQSYSQTVIPQGQVGTAVAGTGPSGPNFNQRLRGNGWRGKGGQS